MAGVSYFYLEVNWLAARGLILSAILAIVCLLIARQLIRRAPAGSHPLYYGTAALYIMFALMLLVRSTHMRLWPTGNAFSNQAVLVVYFLSMMTFDAAWVPSYAMMNRQRMEDDWLAACSELGAKLSELEAALVDVKTLSGLLPMCAYCKKLRDDEAYWRQIGSHISAHSGASFFHGICPECLNRRFPQYAGKVNAAAQANGHHEPTT